MKESFIKAFTWYYGSTRKEAGKMYREVNSDYINAIITAYRNECKKSFYND